jgi:hypothetical protein
MERPLMSTAVDHQLLNKGDAWTKPQKMLAVLLVANLLLSVGTITIIGVVGTRIFDVTSPESLCNTATSCLEKTNLGITDALVAGLDPASWTKVFGDVVQLAKQVKKVDWTLETKAKCNFMVYCYDLSEIDCPTFVGDKGGNCTWGGTVCQSSPSQTWETSKLVASQVVGCQHFSGDPSGCYMAVPIPPSARCTWNGQTCTDMDSTNPGRVNYTCTEDFKVDNSTQQDINKMVERIQSVAQSYHTNSSGTGVSSSLNIPQYIARQLESNWTLTASACVSLTTALLGTNISAFVCDDTVPQCDSFAQWQVVMSAVNILCEKVQKARIVVV